MTIERLHTMLQMVATGSAGTSEAKFDLNLVQFRSFLQTLLETDKLELVDGLYKLSSSK